MQADRSNQMETPKSRTPLWRSLLIPRISLRVLLALVTIICVGLGIHTIRLERAKRQCAACKELARLGWQWNFSESAGAPNKRPAWFRWIPERLRAGDAAHYWFAVDSVDAESKISVEVCRAAAKLPSLRCLSIVNFELNHEVCEEIGKVNRLERLCLERSRIDDRGLESIAKLPRLKKLELQNTRIGNEGLRHLSRLAQLESLWLDETNIDDEGLRSLGKLTSLHTLSLKQTKISAVGFAHLLPLRGLKTLVLDGTNVDDGIADVIERFKALESFHAAETLLTDASCARMLRQPTLKFISLSYTDTGRKTIESLATLPRLKELQFVGIPLSPGDLRALASARKLENLHLAFGAPLEDVLELRKAPALRTLQIGHLEYSPSKLNLLAGESSAETELDLKAFTLGDSGWRRLATCSHLLALHVDDCDLDDARLEELAKLKSLQAFRITNCPITDDGLRKLTPLTRLKSLGLMDCDGVTEWGLAIVSKLPSIEEITANRVAKADPSPILAQLVDVDASLAKRLKYLSWGDLDLHGEELDLFLCRPISAASSNSDLSLKPADRLTDRQVEIIASAAGLGRIYIEGPAILDGQFQRLGPLPNLRLVDLDSARLGPNGIQWLTSLPSLKYLSISNDTLTSDLAKTISTMQQVESIDLRGMKLDRDSLRPISQLPNLTRLELSECQLDDATLEGLIPGALKLDSLTISHHRISAPTLRKLLAGLPSLESLYLTNCDLGPDTIESIRLQGIKLHWLDLSENRITFDDFRPYILDFPELFRLYLGNGPGYSWPYYGLDSYRLEWIRWNELRLQGKETTRPEADRIWTSATLNEQPLQVGSPLIDDALALEIIRANRKWDFLGARHGDLGGPLLQALAQTDHVENLDLSYTQVKDSDLAYLGKLTRLRKLHLSGCQITDAGVALLAEHCWRLTGLSLDNTPITDRALKELAKLRFLETIDLHHTNITDEGILALRGLKKLSSVAAWNTKVTRKSKEQGSRATRIEIELGFP